MRVYSCVHILGGFSEETLERLRQIASENEVRVAPSGNALLEVEAPSESDAEHRIKQVLLGHLVMVMTMSHDG